MGAITNQALRNARRPLDTPRHAFVDVKDIDYPDPDATRVPCLVVQDMPSDGHVEVSEILTPDGETYNIPTGLLIEVQS